MPMRNIFMGLGDRLWGIVKIKNCAKLCVTPWFYFYHRGTQSVAQSFTEIYLKAFNPVTSIPVISKWISWVPS